ncbi:MAG TPA: hypothetical protein VFL91_09055, partial [Thermomicrobiales bacterium]|nr:hypothetical protein [Thermomicrobiales bacterium]
MRLDDTQARFLEHHRSLNHSIHQILHYQATFRDFDRYLTYSRRPKTTASLTPTVFEAYTVWLKN